MLQSTDIPVDIQCISFVPNQRLYIRARSNVSRLVVTGTISFILHVLVAKLIGSLLVTIAEWPLAIEALPMALALVLWTLGIKRGARLDINLAEGLYRVTDATSSSTHQRLPQFAISTPVRQKDGYVCHLQLGNLRIATSTPKTTSDDAIFTFADFARTFAEKSKDTPNSQPRGISSNAKQAGAAKEFSPVSNTKKTSLSSPLVILVHGTWGRRSKWAIPDTSRLNDYLSKRFHEEFGSGVPCVQRFEWSGKNRGSARRKAVAQLRRMVEVHLGSNTRQVFLVAHSHGGNIALAVFHELRDGWKSRVYCVLMATPFLGLEQRFNLSRIYNNLPEFMQTNFPTIGTFGLSFLTWGVIAIVDDVMSEYIGCARQVLTYGSCSLSIWGTIILVIVFIVPPIIFWKLIAGVGSTLQRAEKESSGAQDGSHIHVVSYTQDEVFQILSLIVNALSIVHHVTFLVLLAIVSILKGVRLLDLSNRFLWYSFGLLLLLLGVMWSTSTVVDSMANLLGWYGVAEKLESGLFRDVFLWIYEATQHILGMIFLILLASAGASAFVIFGLVVFGSFRLCVFSIAGVVDQIETWEDVIRALVGTVSVSTVPVGTTSTVFLEGRWLFNHTKIYDHEETMEYISALVVSVCRGESTLPRI